MQSTNWNELFLLDNSLHFLNFGSFGACPAPIFDTYLSFQRELEKDPVDFITRKGPELLNESLSSLAQFIDCVSDDLLFVPNPTYAINLVVNSLKLNPGDEILTTDLEYGAMDYTWDYYAKRNGWVYKRQPITLPLIDKKSFVDEFWKGCTDKTKVVFISHVTSSTALILPVKEICNEAKKRGLICIVDGAHVPGHIPLNLNELEVDFYTGACHKWLMTPKGCSFLYVRNSLSHPLDPLIVSWGYVPNPLETNRFHGLHQFVGTNDFSAYLTVPSALEFRDSMNWKNLCRESHLRALEWARPLSEQLNTKPLAPLNSNFIGQMISLPIETSNPLKLKKVLFDEYRIQIPIMTHNKQNYLRYSIQPFVKEESLSHLQNALKTLGI